MATNSAPLSLNQTLYPLTSLTLLNVPKEVKSPPTGEGRDPSEEDAVHDNSTPPAPGNASAAVGASGALSSTADTAFETVRAAAGLAHVNVSARAKNPALAENNSVPLDMIPYPPRRFLKEKTVYQAFGQIMKLSQLYATVESPRLRLFDAGLKSSPTQGGNRIYSPWKWKS
jgi:hypothetical protein